MKFPPFAQVLKTLVIALIVAIIGYLLFPVLGLDTASGQAIFAIALAVGGILSGVLGAISVGYALPEESGESMTIFVGNLAFKASQDELRELFAPYGTVQSVRIMKDRATRRPRGFAFVEMDSNHAPKAIKALDGKEFLGRKLRVNEGVERSRNND